MLKRPHYIALSLVGFLALVFLNLPNRTASQLKLASGGFFLPLFGLATSAHFLAEQIGTSLTPKRALASELEQMRREVSRYRARDPEVAQLRRENEQLRQALRLQQRIPWKTQFARVVLRDPANWWRTVQIDAGRREGVAPGLPVLSVDGLLVGKTKEVGATTARIALVGDPDCGVSALVEGGTENDAGVIASASSVLDFSVVDLSYVNRPSAVRLGQRVFTSGLGGVFPPGLLVGSIIDTNSVGFGLYTEARVKLAANLTDLEEVWVILPQ